LKNQKRIRKVKTLKASSKATTDSTTVSTKNSSSSVDNDWVNWVHLHGEPKLVSEDVKELGKVVGVKYQCDTSNTFNLLSGEGRRLWRAAGGSETANDVTGGEKAEWGVWSRWELWWAGREVLMKILTYNVRGLGGGEKREKVRRLVLDKHPLVLRLQETKIQVMNDAMLRSVWGNNPVGYSYQPSSGASGGLITAWDASRVDVWSSMSFKHVLIIKGMVITSGVGFILFNVYAPCDLAAKKELWKQMQPLVLNNNDLCLCVCGDFNLVRYVEERNGRGSGFRQVDADFFNKFINDCLLIDLPICGRLFTWYRGDGISMSRLDRFLLSSKWCEKWPNCIQVADQRGLSDHVPLLLHIDDANWGPRPLRMLKCWSDLPGYTDFVRAK